MRKFLLLAALAGCAVYLAACDVPLQSGPPSGSLSNRAICQNCPPTPIPSWSPPPPIIAELGVNLPTMGIAYDNQHPWSWTYQNFFTPAIMSEIRTPSMPTSFEPVGVQLGKFNREHGHPKTK